MAEPDNLVPIFRNAVALVLQPAAGLLDRPFSSQLVVECQRRSARTPQAAPADPGPRTRMDPFFRCVDERGCSQRRSAPASSSDSLVRIRAVVFSCFARNPLGDRRCLRCSSRLAGFGRNHAGFCSYGSDVIFLECLIRRSSRRAGMARFPARPATEQVCAPFGQLAGVVALGSLARPFGLLPSRSFYARPRDSSASGFPDSPYDHSDLVLQSLRKIHPDRRALSRCHEHLPLCVRLLPASVVCGIRIRGLCGDCRPHVVEDSA